MGERPIICSVCGNGIHVMDMAFAQHASCAANARTRIHVGFRVVRMREGKREWLTEYRRWTRDVALCQTHPDKENAEWNAGAVGGRVCKVFLSYGRER